VVLERDRELDVDRMRTDTLKAARGLMNPLLGAVVLECTHLVTFRRDVQELLRMPVFDAVSLIEFFAGGYQLREFNSGYLFPNRFRA